MLSQKCLGNFYKLRAIFQIYVQIQLGSYKWIVDTERSIHYNIKNYDGEQFWIMTTLTDFLPPFSALNFDFNILCIEIKRIIY